MNKFLRVFSNIVLWILTIYCIWSSIMIEGIIYKVIGIITIIFVCPLVNQWIAKKISKRYSGFIRGVICILAIFTNLLVVALSPISLNEKDALMASVDVLKARYANYQTIDVMDYDMSLEKEKDGIQTINFSFTFVATKNGNKKSLTEDVILYFDKSTGTYLTECPTGR